MNVVKGVAAVIYSRTSDVHPTGTNRWFAERYNVNNRNRAQAVTNLLISCFYN